jgi:hypothetical protein
MNDTTFDLYRLLVEEAREARRARRELSNMFLTLNLAGVGALGIIARDNQGLDPALFGWAAGALGLTCIIWRTTNAYYNRALKTKYTIIARYEQQLGERPLYEEYLAMGGAKAMRAFTLERIMPWLFILGYAVFFAVQAGVQVQPLVDQARDALAPLLERIGVR